MSISCYIESKCFKTKKDYFNLLEDIAREAKQMQEDLKSGEVGVFNNAEEMYERLGV